MVKKNKRIKIPFYMKTVAIILAGVIVSAGIAFYYIDKNAERHTITFSYNDGTVINKKSVKIGKGVVPPDFESENVFRGWSGTINNISSDIEVHPMIYNIVEDNLFYFNSVYVKEGKLFSIDIYIGGKVNVSSGELILEYDQEVMTYKKYKKKMIGKVEKVKDGKLYIKFDNETAIKEKTKIATITFHADKKDVSFTQINLTNKNVVLKSKKGETPVTCATINNNIYYLQEVG